MDTNYLFSWLAGTSCALGLGVQLWRWRRRQLGWVVVFGGLLLLLAAGSLWLPDQAGILVAGLWAVLVVAPLTGQRLVQRWVVRQRYAAAHALARLLVLLHPADGLPRQPRWIELLALIHRGELALAAERARLLSRVDPALPRFVALQSLRHERRWPELLDATREPLADLQTIQLRARALGETGGVDELLRLTLAVVPGLAGPLRAQLLLLLFAFLGDREITGLLLEGPLRVLPEPAKRLWLGTAEQAAGNGAAAATLFEPLHDASELHLRQVIDDRLARPVRLVTPISLPERERAALAQLRRLLLLELRLGTLTQPAAGRQRATLALLGVMAVAFLLELAGGSEDPDHLIRLGALVLPLGDYGSWRVVSAAFLHFGLMHLLLNGVNLWLLGGFLERSLGSWRLLVIFLGAAIGANLSALLWEIPAGQLALVVGASGGVMGVLGGCLVIITRAWRQTGAPFLRRQLIFIGAVLAMQLLFDALTPEVSSAIHLGGLVLGVLLGFACSFRFRRA